MRGMEGNGVAGSYVVFFRTVLRSEGISTESTVRGERKALFFREPGEDGVTWFSGLSVVVP